MPNWCTCHLSITGPEAAIDAFKKAACGKAGSGLVFSLEALVPTPQELLDTTKGHFGAGTPKQAALEARQEANLAKYGFADWYAFRVASWGTKWDCDVVAWDTETPTLLQADFDTAWSPPEEALHTIAAAHPKLRFRLLYAEGGCDFAGGLELKGEKVISEWCGSYRDRDREIFGYCECGECDECCEEDEDEGGEDATASEPPSQGEAEV